MNAAAPPTGLAGFLKSLNCDRAYGFGLLAACGLLALLELSGESVREALRFDRAAIGAGQWWRVITAHFVHVDAEHATVNVFGVVLMWALFARDYSPGRWAAIYLACCAGVSAGLLLFNPEIGWYVGASGALHGVMAAGTLAHLRRRDLDGWILGAFLVGKLGYEQLVGPFPFMDTLSTVVDSHFYGAVGGFSLASFLRPRPLPSVTPRPAPGRPGA